MPLPKNIPLLSGWISLCASLLLTAPLYGKEKLEIPINVGSGPAVFTFTGALAENQPLHYGVALAIAAVIDKKTIKKHKTKIPRKYRGMVSRLGEARVGYALIPHSLFLSPLRKDTQIFGATWRPLSVNLPLLNQGLKWGIGTGLVFTYAFIDTIAGESHPTSTTHFLRPGRELRTKMTVPLSRSWLVSLAWSSSLYPPQTLNGPLPPDNKAEEKLWHIGQGNVTLHYRFPFHTAL